jgi:muramoyltetrapeptide carboxypeptidase
MIQPQNLQAGDIIGIVCPAGALPIERVQQCVEILTSWGYQVRLGKTVGGKYFTYSGTDAERTQDLQEMLDDPQVKAVLCGRGGYGLSRIIDEIDFTCFKASPKWVIGFSDITILHAALQKQGYMSIHGPMAAAFNKGPQGEPYIQAMKDLFAGGKTIYTAQTHPLNQIGVATAPMIGGNLCIITHLIGSLNSLDTRGKILFIEDIGEFHYNLDRMVLQMKKAGLFSHLAGLVVGGFSEMRDTPDDIGASAFEILKAHTQEFGYPICFDFPISHALANYPIIEGAMYTLNVNEQQVSLETLV